MFNTAPDFARTAIAAIGTLVFAGACLMGATAPAAAAEPLARTVTVSYDDLNLANPNGRHTLNARINNAARAACFDGSPDVASKIAYSRCVKSAVASAHSQAYSVTASAR